MSFLPVGNPDYDSFRAAKDTDEELYTREVRTKQAFKDSTDINKIIKKAQKAGGLAHVQKYDEAAYGEFAGYDLLEAYGKLNRAQAIFDDLPSEVRNEFGNDALKFAGFASDPNNINRLAELIPAIAEPGSYFPNPIKRGGGGAGAATAPQEPPSEIQAATIASEGSSPSDPPAAPQEPPASSPT